MLEWNINKDKFIHSKSVKKKLGHSYSYLCPRYSIVQSCIPDPVSMSVPISISTHHRMLLYYHLYICNSEENENLKCSYLQYWIFIARVRMDSYSFIAEFFPMDVHTKYYAWKSNLSDNVEWALQHLKVGYDFHTRLVRTSTWEISLLHMHALFSHY